MEENLNLEPKKGFLLKIIKFYNSHIIIFYIISFLIIFIGIFILQKAYYEFSINKFNFAVKLNNKLDKNEYQQLIEKQKKESKIENNYNTITRKRADKKYKLNFILVKPKSLENKNIAPLVNNLRNSEVNKYKDCTYSNCSETISLNYLNKYYSDQKKKHGDVDFNLDIKISEIYEIDDLNKVGDFAYVWGKDPFATANLTDTFESIISKNALDKNELYVFIYFDDSFEVGDDSREGSLYEAKKFRSFADSEKGRAYVNVYYLSAQMSNTVTEIAAHEILHLFGATDKYTEDIKDPNYCVDEGRGEPDKRPLFPQSKADIMCLYIEYQPSKYKRGSILNDELVINKYTAEEIGWKN